MPLDSLPSRHHWKYKAWEDEYEEMLLGNVFCAKLGMYPRLMSSSQCLLLSLKDFPAFFLARLYRKSTSRFCLFEVLDPFLSLLKSLWNKLHRALGPSWCPEKILPSDILEIPGEGKCGGEELSSLAFWVAEEKRRNPTVIRSDARAAGVHSTVHWSCGMTAIP